MLVLKTKKENEESPATEGARRATGVAGEAAGRNGDRPDLEVSDKATRRRFSAAYKRRIVREADQCSQPGELGALLRREGLYGTIGRFAKPTQHPLPLLPASRYLPQHYSMPAPGITLHFA